MRELTLEECRFVSGGTLPPTYDPTAPQYGPTYERYPIGNPWGDGFGGGYGPFQLVSAGDSAPNTVSEVLVVGRPNGGSGGSGGFETCFRNNVVGDIQYGLLIGGIQGAVTGATAGLATGPGVIAIAFAGAAIGAAGGGMTAILNTAAQCGLGFY
ncbi:hypothetical protein [Caulobacter sp. RL271]|uniref:Uncharacterized protein n=1 Tax=Caulobacter segnis TaxID=88688 RepID=A0ABY5A1G8_9CAUL|nr:hypothetical protein [Caulobacter segnis]USQ98666.1 hypothetical protein MZV50_25630 [Caulobacter segnis]